MKKIIIAFICLVLNLSFFSLYSQKNQYGNHFITNYTQDIYGSGPQNYSVVQDNRGVVYVGNQGMILEYDGNSWRQIKIGNNSFVKSMAAGDNGTVYAGATGEFGYLKPDRRGELQYHSLSQQIDSTFQDVYNVYTKGNTVYFSTYKYIFKYQEDSLTDIIFADIHGLHFWDYLIDNTLYVTNYQEGLMKLDENQIVPAKGGQFFSNKDIFFIDSYQEDKLLVGSQNEFYIYDPQAGSAKSIGKLGPKFQKLNQYIKSVTFYGGIKLFDGNYLFYTLDDGLIIFNPKTGDIDYHYTDKNGLIDNTVIDAYETRDGNIWLGLNTGISKIEYNSPIKKFGKESGLKSIKVDLVRFNDDIFVATNLSIYRQLFDENKIPYFEALPKMSQGRNFMEFDVPGTNRDKLLLATHDGIFDMTDVNNIQNISKISKDRIFKTNYMLQSEYYPNRIYSGFTGGLVVFEYKYGEWNYLGEDRNIEENIQNLAEMDKTTLWGATEVNGILKIKLQENSIRPNSPYIENIEITRYDTSKGLPSNDNNKIYKENGEIYFLTENGFYKYNKSKDIFEPDTSGFKANYWNRKISGISKNNENTYWVIYQSEEGNETVDQVLIEADSIQISGAPFKRVEDADYYSSFDEEGPITWIVFSKNIYSYDNSFNRDYDTEYHTLIRNISLPYDSSIFRGTYYKDTIDYETSLIQPDALYKQFDYQHNNISFSYAAPFFEQENNLQYSYKLEGYDKDWSNWSSKTYKEYTNLDAGRYTFVVKARNIYGVESVPARYTFFILPPWYQTIWAYLAYVVIAVALVILIVKWYTRRLEQEKIRLEKIVQERTREVVAQKNQIEHQRDEIAKKNRDITDSIEYASKIQNAVLPGEDFTEKILPEHFVFFRPRDIVSGDFYWIDQKNGLLIIIAADCTGHGVPGAFMSMLGVSLLNEIVNKHETTQANLILNELRDEVKRTLRQTGKEGETKDGMDIAISVLDLNNMKMQYAGAYNPLYLFRDGELIQYKADRMPIGIYIREKPTFTNHEIDVKKGDTFYLFSDGFQDQFGGEDGSKFKAKRLKDVLTDIQDKSMAEQKEILENTFDDWRGDHEQLDDVILIGVRI